MKRPSGQGSVFWECRSGARDATIVVGLAMRGRIVVEGAVSLDAASVWLPACYVVNDESSAGRSISVADAMSLAGPARALRVFEAAQRLSAVVDRSISENRSRTVREPWYRRNASALRDELNAIRALSVCEDKGVA